MVEQEKVDCTEVPLYEPALKMGSCSNTWWCSFVVTCVSPQGHPMKMMGSKFRTDKCKYFFRQCIINMELANTRGG